MTTTPRTDLTHHYAGPFCHCNDYSCRANDNRSARCDNDPWPTEGDWVREAWMDEQQRRADEEELRIELATVIEKQRTEQELTERDHFVLGCAQALR